ncbi:MAG: hypothetical protein HC906_11590 [Bacteroidales bacterium]|nr:hypothetical protein [Bacteroidales bacterium]
MVYASGRDISDLGLLWETIIDWGDEWKYFVPGSTIPDDWKLATFDDSEWIAGNSGFGYGDDDDATLLPNYTVSVFIRKEFTVNDIVKYKKAYLHMDYDDGFVAYLNGNVLANANLNPDASPETFATSHDAVMFSGGKPDAFLIEDIFNYLVEGKNILAIQVHNSSSTSTDLTAIPFFSLGTGDPSLIQNGVSQHLEIRSGGIHTNFKISSKETIYLHDREGVLTDSLKLINQVSIFL